MRFKSEFKIDFKNHYKNARDFIPRGYKSSIDKIYNTLVNDNFDRDTFEDNLYVILDMNIALAKQQDIINKFRKQFGDIY